MNPLRNLMRKTSPYCPKCIFNEIKDNDQVIKPDIYSASWYNLCNIKSLIRCVDIGIFWF